MIQLQQKPRESNIINLTDRFTVRFLVPLWFVMESYGSAGEGVGDY